MLFWKSWFDKKVFFIQDILNSDGNFLTFEEFQNKFCIKKNYLHYFQLMAAIPSDLKKKAMSAEVPSHEQLLYSTTYRGPRGSLHKKGQTHIKYCTLYKQKRLLQIKTTLLQIQKRVAANEKIAANKKSCCK